MGNSLIQSGRPKVIVDSAIVLRLRDEENLGWSRGAEQYRIRTGQWISRDTFKRRYFEANAAKSPLERFIDEIRQWKLKI